MKDLTKIYKYSILFVFIIVILFRIQVGYTNKIDKLSKQILEEQINNAELISEMNYLQDIKKEIISSKYLWPIVLDDYKNLTSPYGLRINPLRESMGGGLTSHHKGIDIKGVYEARIISIADGVVVEHWLPPGYHNGKYYQGNPVLGGMIKIKNTDGTYAIYGHLSETYVSEVGSKRFVKAGQVIGRQGSTGMSTGPHLHFELHDKDDFPVQPLKYIKNPNYY